MNSKSMLRRGLLIAALLGATAVLSGCSFSTNFVVINDSDESIVVRYKVKEHPGSFSPPVWPAYVPMAEFDAKYQREWNNLADMEVRLDPASRTIVVILRPHEALRIATMSNYLGHDEPAGARNFPIEELHVLASGSEINAVGDEVRRSFGELSRNQYALTFE